MITMTNKAYLDPASLIRNDYVGDQTNETVNDMRQQTELLINQCRNQGKAVRLLVDLAAMGRQDLSARLAALEALKLLDYDKLAVVNASPLLQEVSNFVIMASGMQHKARCVGEMAEAIVWLKDSQQTNSEVKLGG